MPVSGENRFFRRNYSLSNDLVPRRQPSYRSYIMGFLKSPGDLKLNHCRDITSAFQTSTALTTFIVVYLISSSMAVVTPPNGTQTSSSDENPFMMDDCKVWLIDDVLLNMKHFCGQVPHLRKAWLLSHLSQMHD